MKATLIVEGKEFPIEIHDPELQKLLKPKKKTGYERVGEGHTYSFVNTYGEVTTLDDVGSDDDLCYDEANYYSDRTVAENNARADKLMRQLRRFAAKHREKDLGWDNQYVKKYCIRYEHDIKKIRIDSWLTTQFSGIVYFNSSEVAESAIETFHDELIWYFTEYKDSL